MIKERTTKKPIKTQVHSSYSKRTRKLIKKMIQGFNFRNFDHFASKCKFNLDNGGKDDKARMAQGQSQKRG